MVLLQAFCWRGAWPGSAPGSRALLTRSGAVPPSPAAHQRPSMVTSRVPAVTQLRLGGRCPARRPAGPTIPTWGLAGPADAADWRRQTLLTPAGMISALDRTIGRWCRAIAFDEARSAAR